MISSLSEDFATSAKKEKQKRRQSWADFVIPRDVLEKQKGLKEGIGAVKKFAGGVESESDSSPMLMCRSEIAVGHACPSE